jgi:hypothetical protein
LRKPRAFAFHPGNTVSLSQSLRQEGWQPNITVITNINGSIIPDRPTLNKDQIIETVVQNLDDRGVIMNMSEQRKRRD